MRHAGGEGIRSMWDVKKNNERGWTYSENSGAH